MTSLNDWVPTAAFIEHYVIEEALRKDISIREASLIIVPTFGLPVDAPFLHVQTRLLGMFYTLLVFPREQWKRDQLLDVVVERAKTDSELSNTIRERLSLSFLRSIRNAVAHARIEFSEDSVTLRDGRDDASLTFEVMLSIREAVNLCLVLARAFHESAQVKETLIKAGKG